MRIGVSKLLRGQLQISANARPFARQHKTPCIDCPWARRSLPGWLGPNTIEQWLAVARDYWHRISCHTRRQFNGKHWECAGAAIYRANTCVRPFAHQPLLRLPANTVVVFESPMEFTAHHDDSWKRGPA